MGSTAMAETEERRVNGTLIWYYYVCKREVWLIAHNISADQDNEFLDVGRFIHENSYKRDRKEINVGNVKLDVLQRDEGQWVVGEVKKSSKYVLSAKMQLLYYLWILKEMGIDVKGELLFPEEKKRVEVLADEESLKELKRAEEDIVRIINQSMPPVAQRIPFCKNCAYLEFCWA
ncbi:CRISPR-associated protein Cas4 [Caldanaerobius polysaccharolyticus]|uniref:CRISPR-associated protein Cas4 n=1 Tax=Caldanaerobius polysaccharolyticus TaxID=44256 RepID=UPI000B1FD47F|nr:CRISPR-associated protein Cas4 [Caldanaerobius polysaccharolyticus]